MSRQKSQPHDRSIQCLGVAEHRDLASCQAVKIDSRSANTCCRQKERHLLAEVTAHGADQLLLQHSITSRQVIMTNMDDVQH